ncbi:MAG TPA: zf-HC2 domain-containing protein [Anaerolineales bacterium]|nr:zf-HC2 domain-containing protein [Anaerolineales bacterium]
MSSDMNAHLDPEVIQAFLDGSLSPAEARRAEAHLASCAACSKQAVELRAVFEWLATLPDEPLTTDLRPAVLRRLRPRRRPSGRLAWLLAAEAAGTALALVGAWRWLGEILSPYADLTSNTWPAVGWDLVVQVAERIWEGASGPIAQGMSLLAGLRLGVPQPAIPLPQILALIGAAAALWLVGHRVLLRSQLAPQGLEEGAR